ncbi:MAG: hypothetical protein ABI876_13170 [Bacteroidota bacterium]
MSGMLRRLAIPLVALSLLATACGHKEKKPATAERQPPPGQPATAAKAIPDTGVAEKIVIKTPEGTRPVEFHIGKNETKIESVSAGLLLRGVLRDDGKRKYEREGGSAIAEVKSEGSHFKLRTTDGKLLWKIKDDGAKIKISNNEENANPYELKRGDEEISVRENGTEIGKVKFYTDRGKVKVKDAAGKELYESNNERQSTMFGVMLMARIPETERYIIMAELASRGL